MKCSSRHTFQTFAPIDSTFCTPGMYIQVSGGPREAHDWSQPTLRGGLTPSPISVCAYLPRNGHSRPWEEAQLPPPYRLCTTLVVGFL